MKNLIFILFLFPTYLFGQETIDTISHINGECIGSEPYDKEEFNFSLCNDTLNFYGKISANCGGNHFLIYVRQIDIILLTKLDTGELEDCMCLYNFDISIPECDKNKHRLILQNYSGNDTIVDTLISSTPTFIQNQKKNDIVIFPNPTNGWINIKFSKTEININVKIFDCEGQCLFRNSYTNSDNVIISEIFPDGIYLMRIDTDNKTYSTKLIIN
jgi:hypothetical protein